VDRISTNVIANFIGVAWSALLQLLLTPMYIALLGFEGYGLIGLYSLVQLGIRLLDSGATQAVTHHIAHRSHNGRDPNEHSFFSTLEGIYLLLALFTPLLALWAAPTIATHWVHPTHLPERQVTAAISWMGLMAGVTGPLTLYQAVISGYQQQRALNIVRVLSATVTGFSTVLALAISEQSGTNIYFALQAIGLCTEAIASRIVLVHVAEMPWWPGQIHLGLVRPLLKSAIIMSATAAVGIFASNLDKLIVSLSVPLEVFGYYTLGTRIASVVMLCVIAVFNAYFPYFTGLAADSDESRLKIEYHKLAQLLSLLLLPVAGTWFAFGEKLLAAWTGSSELAELTFPIATFLVAAAVINGISNAQFILQLAAGWASASLSVNVLNLAVAFPLTWWLSHSHGAVGASAGWFCSNVILLLAGVYATHRRLLRGEVRRWVLQDFGGPLMAAAATIPAGVALAQAIPSAVGAVVYWLASSAAVLAVCAPMRTRVLRATVDLVRERLHVRND
jgi:O-antigen/teichoic acid export membrane protein